MSGITRTLTIEATRGDDDEAIDVDLDLIEIGNGCVRLSVNGEKAVDVEIELLQRVLAMLADKVPA